MEHPCPLQAPRGTFQSSLAWAATWNAQPHHVSAPFPAERSAPIEVRGLCERTNFGSLSFEAPPNRKGEWVALPIRNVSVTLDQGRSCSQQFAGLSVSTATEASAAALRLHFSGCSLPESVLSVRLVDDDEDASIESGPPPVRGVELVDFMCQLSSTDCRIAKQVQNRHASEANEQLEGKIGVGSCSGVGVRPRWANASTASDCADVCAGRIAANLQDSSQLSCRGFAWSTRLGACRVYDGWPIMASDGDGSEGFVCYKAPGAKLAPTSTIPPPTSPVLEELHEARLDLAALFAGLSKASVLRRVQVSSFTPGCFAPFEWYILDRAIHVPTAKFALLREMAHVNVSQFVYAAPSEGGHAPRSNLIVESVCIKGCDGSLAAQCMEDKLVPAVAPDGRAQEGLRDLSAEVSVANNTVDNAIPFTSSLYGALGPEAAEALDSLSESWLWVSAFAVVSLLLGYIVTSGVLCCRKKAKPPKYQTVEEIKLVYDGEEEEEVVLQPTAGGNMMSMYGSGAAMASWQPSKALSGQLVYNTPGLAVAARVVTPEATMLVHSEACSANAWQ
eukprot:CAMPEP_0172806526 /NCGR_PEP_ID=MMETSP1075-20121228/6414_1 /TAXON_ID=2916 /ORGANISM="Ceratium fusus, Strain PA161109" /LENGTH=560 /DNA_ID=CAMNT_0013645333 /DNA_START=66 /DNA_END=1746 /DNA_ORIENTATION=+